MTSKPEITIFFSIGVIGMDEPATEYITIPLDGRDIAEEMQMKAQIAQLKLQVGFLELMTQRFPEWALKKAEEEGWVLPE